MEKPIISPSLVLLDLVINDKQGVIQTIARQAFENGYVSNQQEFIEAVTKRESEMSTAIGYGVAMPHGKSDAVLHPFIAFARLKSPFLWDDEEQISLVFLIGVPKTAFTLHLKFISELSKKLLDDDYRNQLLTQREIAYVVKQLNIIEI